jgi:hypothetical protein
LIFSEFYFGTLVANTYIDSRFSPCERRLAMTNGALAFERSDRAGMDTAKPIAVVPVREKGELGNYLMGAILERVPHLCSNIIFWSVSAKKSWIWGVGPSGAEDKEDLVKRLQMHVHAAKRRNLGAAYYYAEGKDELKTAESLCAVIADDFPVSTFYFLLDAEKGREESRSRKLREKLVARGLSTSVLPLTLADFACT